MSCLIFSCVFGTKFKKVYNAPETNHDCIFFTNNASLKEEIETKGWVYYYINHELTNDYLISSVQAKYIKFLVFLNDFPELKKYDHYMYFDHKYMIKKSNIDILLKDIESNKDKYAILRETPRTTIQQEINAAMGQERYKKNMHKTKHLIEELVKSNKIKQEVKIRATGMIIYINYKPLQEMLKKIYDTSIELQQPECQILWAVFAQDFEKYIKGIPWNEISIINKIP